MILIVDDDRSVTASLALLLKQAGYASHAEWSPDSALEWLGRERCQLVLQDMNFSRRTSGEEGLQDVRIVQALYESAQTGKAVAIPPFEKSKRPDGRQRITRPGVKKPKLVKVQSAGVD